MEPAYGGNAPGNIFPDITINGGDGAGQIGLGGGVHAVLADGAYVAGDIVTLIRGRHTVKMGGEFDKSYQNYTNWGDVSSGNFQFNGIGTAQFWPGGNYPDTTGRLRHRGLRRALRRLPARPGLRMVRVRLRRNRARGCGIWRALCRMTTRCCRT